MSSQGPALPGTVAQDASIGTVNWSGLDSIKSSSDAGSSASVSAVPYTAICKYVKVSNFGFTIPSGATIDGIVVEVCRRSPSGGLRDYSVRLVKGGTISGDNKAVTGSNWPFVSLVTVSYGGSAVLWGLSLTPDDVNSSTFGFVISCYGYSYTKYGDSGLIDFIRMTIYYTEGGGGGGVAKQYLHLARQRSN